MLNFDARVKNSDAAQPRVTNVKTPNSAMHKNVLCRLSNFPKFKQVFFGPSWPILTLPADPARVAPGGTRSVSGQCPDF